MLQKVVESFFLSWIESFEKKDAFELIYQLVLYLCGQCIAFLLVEGFLLILAKHVFASILIIEMLKR